MIRVNGIEYESIVDGPGIRMTIFTQGCPHHCPGCHNPHTLPLEGGRLMSAEDIFEEFKENPLLRGITFSGGEPTLQAKELLPLARLVKASGRDIVLFSGYTLEELLEKSKTDEPLASLLRLTYLLVDGPYMEAKRDLTLLFRGSRNQRLLLCAESFQQKKPVPYEKGN